MAGNESVAVWLKDISTEAVCGENLEYAPDFLALEQAILGKPEVQYGDTVTAAIPPDWKQVKSLALDLNARSLDLRIALPLTRALLKLEGITGFATGMLYIEQLLEQRWDHVHPQLDPDDDLDPMLRVNTLSTLCEAPTVLRDLRECPLVASKVHGRFNLRDIDIATGDVEPVAGEQKTALPVIDAAFRDADPEAVAATLAALEQAYQRATRIEVVLTEKVGTARSIDLSALTKTLQRARVFVAARGAAEPEASNDAVPAEGAAEGAPATASVRVVVGEINSRDDVVRMLGKMCDYYAKHEPSSPIPLLLTRAQRLADKTFLEILEDLAPDGMSQMRVISGKQDN